jgi:tRNA U34 5-carboxymethylaminomethyl modifying GTPase MnmE/TrmE
VKRILSAIFLSLVLASFAAAQTMAEAAQKEKERREELKGKAVVVVTNADLSKTRKKVSAAGPAAESDAVAKIAGDAAATDARQAEIDKKYAEMKADLEAKAASAKERAELLDLKLKSLQQRFFTFNSMQTKDKIQQEIAQAYQMLQAAAAEQVRTKDDLANFLELAGRDKAAAVGIK